MAARRLRLLSTIGPVEAGIVPALLAAYAAEAGPVETALTAADTGKALDLARHGGFDAVLAHAPALEARFVAWLLSPPAQARIAGFGVDGQGEPLFVPRAGIAVSDAAAGGAPVRP